MQVRKVDVTVAGLAATPVLERVLIERGVASQEKVILVELRHRRYGVWIGNGQAAVTVERFRGGIRTWSSLDTALLWLRQRLPGLSVVELHLQALPAATSS